MVRRLATSAQALRRTLAEFKTVALGEADTFRDILAEKYSVQRGGKKGNMTFRTFDGAFEMQVAVSRGIEFGPELQVAKDLIDECVADWAKDADDKIRALVNHAFQVNKEGRIDTGRVLGLRRLDIDDEKWTRAMNAAVDAVRETHSKTYLRFYSIDPETGTRSPISLDIAAI